jgi:hypothetical protein
MPVLSKRDFIFPVGSTLFSLGTFVLIVSVNGFTIAILIGMLLGSTAGIPIFLIGRRIQRKTYFPEAQALPPVAVNATPILTLSIVLSGVLQGVVLLFLGEAGIQGFLTFGSVLLAWMFGFLWHTVWVAHNKGRIRDAHMWDADGNASHRRSSSHTLFTRWRPRNDAERDEQRWRR